MLRHDLCAATRPVPPIVNEFDLIRSCFLRPTRRADVIEGIGDDGAVLRPPPGKDLVTVIDTLVGNVHFPAGSDETSARSVGHRAAAVNLSDIAAMGAEPAWMTLALTLPAIDETWVHRFADGLLAIADDHGVALVGGDTTSGDNVVVTVQITGFVDPGREVRRSGAKEGDTIYVTGTVGDAAAGLNLLEHPAAEVSGLHDYLQDRFRFPTPRIAVGRKLCRVASSAIDISDGLYTDLDKILAASGVGAVIDLDSLPLSPALRHCFDADRRLRFALSGGDDYELCFTAAAGLPRELAGTPLTPIGKITQGGGIVCTARGQAVDYVDSGYVHFR